MQASHSQGSVQPAPPWPHRPTEGVVAGNSLQKPCAGRGAGCTEWAPWTPRLALLPPDSSGSAAISTCGLSSTQKIRWIPGGIRRMWESRKGPHPSKREGPLCKEPEGSGRRCQLGEGRRGHQGLDP